MPDFLQLLKSKPVVLLDGAMGTELDKRGLMGRGRANLDAPQAVIEVHETYVQAGSDALITNTLTMNRIYIDTHGVDASARGRRSSVAAAARRPHT